MSWAMYIGSTANCIIRITLFQTSVATDGTKGTEKFYVLQMVSLS
jgi:hypothetical protein